MWGRLIDGTISNEGREERGGARNAIATASAVLPNLFFRGQQQRKKSYSIIYDCAADLLKELCCDKDDDGGGNLYRGAQYLVDYLLLNICCKIRRLVG